MDGGVRSPEAAKRLGVRGRDVYMLLFAGELDGGPGRDGIMYFDEASIDAYLERHGFGNVSNIVSNEPRRTDPDDAGRAASETTTDPDAEGLAKLEPISPTFAHCLLTAPNPVRRASCLRHAGLSPRAWSPSVPHLAFNRLPRGRSAPGGPRSRR